MLSQTVVCLAFADVRARMLMVCSRVLFFAHIERLPQKLQAKVQSVFSFLSEPRFAQMNRGARSLKMIVISRISYT